MRDPISGEDYVVGVLVKGTENPSHDRGCGVAGRYGVYTRISRYKDFIHTTITGGSWSCPNCFSGNVRTSCTSDPVIGGPAPPGTLDPIFGENATIVVGKGAIDGQVAGVDGARSKLSYVILLTVTVLGLGFSWYS